MRDDGKIEFGRGKKESASENDVLLLPSRVPGDVKSFYQLLLASLLFSYLKAEVFSIRDLSQKLPLLPLKFICPPPFTPTP